MLRRAWGGDVGSSVAPGWLLGFAAPNHLFTNFAGDARPLLNIVQ
jgi:hypothetical protein